MRWRAIVLCAVRTLLVRLVVWMPNRVVVRSPTAGGVTFPARGMRLLVSRWVRLVILGLLLLQRQWPPKLLRPRSVLRLPPLLLVVLIHSPLGVQW